MRIYLCSRTALEARPANSKVAAYLRRLGHDVFVPHTAPYNQADNPEVPDESVRTLDMLEMKAADACVIVGRIGVDCAYEVGWFGANGVPTIWYVPKDVPTVGRHPMLSAVQQTKSLTTVQSFLIDNVTKPKLRASFARGSRT